MNPKDRFNANLVFGTIAENQVHSFLINNFDYVEDNRFQRREHNVGPKLRGRKAPLDGITLPDFTVFNENSPPILIDAKAKNSAFYLDGKRYFAVDVDKHQDYLRCAEIKGAIDVWVAIVYNNDIYLYTSEDIYCKYSFNNEYGTEAFLFELNSNKKV